MKITTAGQTFWFDRFQYTPPSNLTMETAVLLVDNHNPAVIFDLQWQAWGDKVHITQVTGATMTFLFTGLCTTEI